jgi:hypothetical protein
MNTLAVGTNQGTVEVKWDNNGKGIVDEQAITAFSWGHCHSFAYEMHDLTGWPIIGIGSRDPSDPHDAPGHFVVYDPRIDDFVDIQGGNALERYEWLTNRGIDEVPPDVRPMKYRSIKKDMAKPFVETVLEKLAQQPVRHGYRKWKQYMKEPFTAKHKVLDKR